MSVPGKLTELPKRFAWRDKSSPRYKNQWRRGRANHSALQTEISGLIILCLNGTVWVQELHEKVVSLSALCTSDGMFPTVLHAVSDTIDCSRMSFSQQSHGFWWCSTLRCKRTTTTEWVYYLFAGDKDRQKKKKRENLWHFTEKVRGRTLPKGNNKMPFLFLTRPGVCSL